MVVFVLSGTAGSVLGAGEGLTTASAVFAGFVEAAGAVVEAGGVGEVRLAVLKEMAPSVCPSLVT